MYILITVVDGYIIRQRLETERQDPRASVFFLFPIDYDGIGFRNIVSRLLLADPSSTIRSRVQVLCTAVSLHCRKFCTRAYIVCILNHLFNSLQT